MERDGEAGLRKRAIIGMVSGDGKEKIVTQALVRMGVDEKSPGYTAATGAW